MKNQITIQEIKKYLNKKGFVISKKIIIKNRENNFGILSRTFLTSLIIISFFFYHAISYRSYKRKYLFLERL